VKVWLCRTSGGEPARTIILGDEPVQVGRDPTAHVPILEQQISRRHCEFRKVGNELLIRDLSSKNGTYVNYIRVTERFLVPGDNLVIGRTEFTVEFEAASPGAEASPAGGEFPEGDTASASPLPARPGGDGFGPSRSVDTEIGDLGDTVVFPEEVVVMGGKRRSSPRRAEPDLPHAPIPPPKIAGASAGRAEPHGGLPRETTLTAISADPKTPPADTDPLLDEFLAAWPRLPPVIRSGIIAMVKATLPKG
jgi:predicted component of type VI protein secretion system